jgi:hypothetical protein
MRRFVFPLLWLSILTLNGFANVRMSATPAVVDFKTLKTNFSKDSNILITNTGPVDLQIDNIFVAGGNSTGEFKVIVPSTPSLVLPVGGTQVVTIRFSPQNIGARNSTLRFQTFDGEFTVELFGNGLDIQPNLITVPGNIDFGLVTPGVTKDSSFYFVCIGPDTAVINTLQLTNSNGGIFFDASVDGVNVTFPDSLAPGDSLKVDVHFIGQEPLGQKDGSVFAEGSITGTSTCILTGKVVQADIRVSPTFIDFGDVYLGSIHDTTVTIYSTGEVPLVLNELELIAFGFSIMNPPIVPLTLQPHESLVLDLRFNPNTIGPVTTAFGMLVKEASEGGRFRSVSLKANVLPSPSEVNKLAPLDFYCASDSQITRTITLTDTGTAKLILTSVNSTDSLLLIRASRALPDTLSEGESISITITVTPGNYHAQKTAIVRFLGGESAFQFDTLFLNPIAFQTGIKLINRSISTTSFSDTVNVVSTSDFSQFNLKSFDCFLRLEHQDFGQIVPGSIKLNSSVITSGSYSATLQPDGVTYLVSITSPTPMKFNSGSLDAQPLFTFEVAKFIALDTTSNIFAQARYPEKEDCINVSSDTSQALAGVACGSNLIRKALGNKSIIGLVQLTTNPVRDNNAELLLQLDNPANVRISVIDLLGAEKLSLNKNYAGSTTDNIALDLSGISSGSYVIRTEATTPNAQHEVRILHLTKLQ